MNRLTKIAPDQLNGPRSYFTDIDRMYANSGGESELRKLKLQLITKEKVIVAASSLFSKTWSDLIHTNPDIKEAFEVGAIVPALRHDLVDLSQAVADYGEKGVDFDFLDTFSEVVEWDPNITAAWYEEFFLKGVTREDSVLYRAAALSKKDVDHIVSCLQEKDQDSLSQKHFSRPDVEKAIAVLDEDKRQKVRDYSDLIYGLAGAKAVNSDGHFPQSELLSGNSFAFNSELSSDSIFWDIYVGAVVSSLGAAVRLQPNRLDNLTFSDILLIRDRFLDADFITLYDDLVVSAKSAVCVNNPDAIVFNAQEISSIARELREILKDKVAREFGSGGTKNAENALWQIASTVALVSTPPVGLAMGIVSSLKSIPEMTALFSPKLASDMETKLGHVRDFVNTRIGWSATQKKVLLDGYKELVTYGLV